MRDAGLPVSLESDPRGPGLTDEASAAAYRVIQESLTNVLRHAGKVPTQVRVTRHAEGLEIEIRDNGTPQSARPMGAGNGLLGMKERVSDQGGTLTCGPSPDGGFRVQALLPVDGRR